MRVLAFLIGPGDFDSLLQLFEFSECFFDLAGWFSAEDRRERRAEFTRGRMVLEGSANHGTPPASRALEAHVARIVKIRSIERSPADHFVFPIGSDLGIPFERHTAGCSQAPVRPPGVEPLYRFDIFEQRRQVLLFPP